jgi:hypothetical protein
MTEPEQRQEIGRAQVRTEEPQLVRLLSSEDWQIDAAVWSALGWTGADAERVALAVVELRNQLAGIQGLRQMTIRFLRK